eukprot:TRINITY_DN35608_c0_g1_i1.p1 TRINITY_DN35608_c0_g1~~TRINITY_DN35608_c0_g1_i1.p1  ORF type:complete len:137 (-),score=14.94 TRINITY_DN35608_c0_g1_i1:68-478(-)
MCGKARPTLSRCCLCTRQPQIRLLNMLIKGCPISTSCRSKEVCISAIPYYNPAILFPRNQNSFDCISGGGAKDEAATEVDGLGLDVEARGSFALLVCFFPIDTFLNVFTITTEPEINPASTGRGTKQVINLSLRHG